MNKIQGGFVRISFSVLLMICLVFSALASINLPVVKAQAPNPPQGVDSSSDGSGTGNSGCTAYSISIDVDGINISICSPFKPDYVDTSDETEVVQSANLFVKDMSSQMIIYAIPYGLYPAGSDLPMAKKGIYQEYLKLTKKVFNSESVNVVDSPTIEVFQTVTPGYTEERTIYQGENLVTQINSEWILEAGQRVWFIRYIRNGVQGEDKINKFVASELSDFSITTDDLSPTSISLENARKSISSGKSNTPADISASSDLPTPSWWSGDCDVNNFAGSYALGSSYRGIKACGPLPFTSGKFRIVNFGIGVSQKEWQCAELSKRYLYLAYGIAPYSANGNDVVNNCPANSNLEKVSNGTANKGPIAGDVISYSGPTADGHTSIVSSSSIDGNGNGTIVIIEQNYSNSGTRVHNVSNWSVQSGDGVTGWLHQIQQSGGCSAPSLSSPGNDYVSNSQSISFSWSALSGCTFNGYTFRVKDTSNMESGGTTIVDTGEGSTTHNVTFGTDWNNKDLYWGVKAANAPNGASWAVRHFRIQPGSTPGTGSWHGDFYDTIDRWWDNNNGNNYKCSVDYSGSTLDQNYGTGAPCSGMDGDSWIGDYRATINFPANNYVFILQHDDGIKVWLNGTNIADRGGSAGGDDYVCSERYLSGDQNLRAMLREDGGDARIKITWTTDIGVCHQPGVPSISGPSNGQSFTDRDPITLSWSSSGNQYYGEIWGGPGGTLAFGWQSGTSINIGTQWPGYTYSWHVRSKNNYGTSDWSETRTFVVSAACHTLSLSHTGSGSNPSASPAKSSACTDNYTYVSGETVNLTASPSNGYRVTSWSGVKSVASNYNSIIMSSTNAAVSVNYVNTPTKPALTSPINATIVNSLTPTLNWGTSVLPKGTNVARYQVQLSKSSTFSGLVFDKMTAYGIASAHYFKIGSNGTSALAAGTQYYWRARTILTNGIKGPWSSTGTFRTLAKVPAQISPANGASLGGSSVTFKWSAVSVSSGVVSYTLQYSTNSSFLTCTSVTISSTSKTVTLPTSGKYYWRIRAVTSRFGTSGWSSVHNFYYTR